MAVHIFPNGTVDAWDRMRLFDSGSTVRITIVVSLCPINVAPCAGSMGQV